MFFKRQGLVAPSGPQTWAQAASCLSLKNSWDYSPVFPTLHAQATSLFYFNFNYCFCLFKTNF